MISLVCAPLPVPGFRRTWSSSAARARSTSGCERIGCPLSKSRTGNKGQKLQRPNQPLRFSSCAATMATGKPLWMQGLLGSMLMSMGRGSTSVTMRTVARIF